MLVQICGCNLHSHPHLHGIILPAFPGFSIDTTRELTIMLSWLLFSKKEQRCGVTRVVLAILGDAYLHNRETRGRSCN